MFFRIAKERKKIFPEEFLFLENAGNKKLLQEEIAFVTIIKLIFGPIAQLAEHSTENAGVGSSTLPWATILEQHV